MWLTAEPSTLRPMPGHCRDRQAETAIEWKAVQEWTVPDWPPTTVGAGSTKGRPDYRLRMAPVRRAKQQVVRRDERPCTVWLTAELRTLRPMPGQCRDRRAETADNGRRCRNGPCRADYRQRMVREVPRARMATGHVWYPNVRANQ